MYPGSPIARPALVEVAESWPRGAEPPARARQQTRPASDAYAPLATTRVNRNGSEAAFVTGVNLGVDRVPPPRPLKEPVRAFVVGIDLTQVGVSEPGKFGN